MNKRIKIFVPFLENHEFEGLSVCASRGLIPEAKKVLQIAKDLDLVVFTGHLSAGESIELARQAEEIGFQKLIFGQKKSSKTLALVDRLAKRFDGA
jgi:dihydrodipicolinate synthase/N-acetylneuraminate lyase